LATTFTKFLKENCPPGGRWYIVFEKQGS
jgi:hypothetical protein